jgi:hypothetical protein
MQRSVRGPALMPLPHRLPRPEPCRQLPPLDPARSGPTKEAHRRAIYRSDGLLRSVAGRDLGDVGDGEVRPRVTA